MAAPVLVKIDTAAVTTAGPNVVTIVGSVPLPAGLNEDAIRGLSFDPISGDLYGALKVPSAVDRLVKISAADASLVDIGPIQSAALGVTAENAEDIEFDDAGKLYVSDRTADDLYQVDPATGAILAIVDNDLPGGLGLAADNPVDVEALAWDPALQQMVGIEDEANLFYLQTFDNGNNVPLGVLSQLGSTSLHRFCHSPQNARHRHGEDDQRPIELQPDRSRL